jgi:hypothetical protein
MPAHRLGSLLFARLVHLVQLFKRHLSSGLAQSPLGGETPSHWFLEMKNTGCRLLS